MTQDLLVVTADRTMKGVIDALLKRHQAFQIRKIQFQVDNLNTHDPGMRTGGVQYARNFCSNFNNVLLMFDYDGSGAQRIASEEEQYLEARLQTNGWKQDHSAVIIFEPELESWIWGDSPHIEEICGWEDRTNPNLREWLTKNNHLKSNSLKPNDPKKALEKALRNANPRVQFSAAIHKKIAEKASFRNCQDRAFNKFKTTLQRWFPKSETYQQTERNKNE